MGDVLHAIPAVSSLHRSFPDAAISWLVSPKWRALLEGNPALRRIISFDRGALSSWRQLRHLRPALALDFQGLLQSAIAGRMTRPVQYIGFDKTIARETLASNFYKQRISADGKHRIERNVQLAAAAGATDVTYDSWLPPGEQERNLPRGPFVLASPFAGWPGKEWPLESYDALGRSLRKEGLELVINAPAARYPDLLRLEHAHAHSGSLAGLIGATRRAVAVVGLDSGPLHLAAALRKPGVALFGPTDPVQTGPFGGTITVLRPENVETTYKRHQQIHQSMRAIPVEQVFQALMDSIPLRFSTSNANA
jgi:heptosyltransferase-1